MDARTVASVQALRKCRLRSCRVYRVTAQLRFSWSEAVRPSLKELAQARRKAQWFLTTVPDHSMADTLRTFLEATAPVTKEEALPVMIANANEAGEWPGRSSDLECAKTALRTDIKIGSWETTIRAQWSTLRHFMGGAE